METKRITVKAPTLNGLIDKVVGLASQGAVRCPKACPRLGKGVKSVIMDVPVEADLEKEVLRQGMYGATVIVKASNPITLIDKLVKVASNGGVRATSIASGKSSVALVVPTAPNKEPNLLVQPIAVDARGKRLNEEDVEKYEKEQEITEKDAEEGSKQDQENGSETPENRKEPEPEVSEYLYSEGELKEMDIGQLKSLCDQRGLPRRKAKDKCIKEIISDQNG